MGLKFLLIEDDPDIAAVLSAQLREPQVHIHHEQNGSRGLQQALDHHWDLMIVDMALPGTHGLDICRRVRAQACATPFLFVTARDAEHERVAGLDAGADDYLIKPFGLAELRARVRALLRRSQLNNDGSDTDEQSVTDGELFLDPRTRVALRWGKPLDLTAKEFALLYFLMRHRERAFTREQLLNRIWGSDFDGFAHTVNSHINRLRAKIEPNASEPKHIVTVWGQGYRFASSAPH